MSKLTLVCGVLSTFFIFQLGFGKVETSQPTPEVDDDLTEQLKQWSGSGEKMMEKKSPFNHPLQTPSKNEMKSANNVILKSSQVPEIGDLFTAALWSEYHGWANQVKLFNEICNRGNNEIQINKRHFDGQLTEEDIPNLFGIRLILNRNRFNHPLIRPKILPAVEDSVPDEENAEDLVEEDVISEVPNASTLGLRLFKCFRNDGTEYYVPY